MQRYDDFLEQANFSGIFSMKNQNSFEIHTKYMHFGEMGGDMGEAERRMRGRGRSGGGRSGGRKS